MKPRSTPNSPSGRSARTARAADPASAPRRRNRTRQRERLLEHLRAASIHPTAAEIHASLVREFPTLSLATVYRNLEVLVSEGRATTVPSPDGAMRYDGNVDPHHHFTCEACGVILDVELAVPDGLAQRLRRKYGVKAARVHVDVYGRCDRCR